MTNCTGTQPFNLGQSPAIFAIGDPWFWCSKNNLINALARSGTLNKDSQHMVRFGANRQ
jgi:hypothetical protein